MRSCSFVAIGFQHTAIRSASLAICLAALPALQEIVYHFRPRGIANISKIDLDTVIGVLDEWAVGKFYRHIGIGGAEAVHQRLFLNRLGKEKVEEGLRGFSLIFGTPRSIDDVVGIFVPGVVFGIGHADFAPAAFGVFQVIDSHAFIYE